MKTGFLGNHRLQALVQAQEAMIVPEVVQVVDSHVKDLKSEWQAGSATGGTVEYPDAGGARLSSTATTLVDPLTNNGSEVSELTHIAPSAAVIVTWTGARASEQELHNLIARIDPRADGGLPKTASEFRAQLFRVDEAFTSGLLTGYILEPISKEVSVDATGEAPADFTFDFQGEGIYGGYPRVGQSPVGVQSSQPRTVVRIIALQSDGTVADNVAWLANSGGDTDSGTGWTAKLHRLTAITGAEADEVGGAAYVVSDYPSSIFPEFTLSRAAYQEATITFSGSPDEIPDLTGSGDLVIIAEGHTPSDSVLTWEIWDGTSAWVECFDGDVIGEDNTAQGGADLTSIPTTGPWDMRVMLMPSTVAGLNTPYATLLGIERTVSSFLPGVGMLYEGVRQVNPQTLKGNIAKAQLVISKTGEQDYRDYGSNILAENHTGQIDVRVWVRDKDGTQLDRSEWMRLGTWSVEDYRSTDTRHEIDLLSPMQLLRRIVPPFTVTSGNDGTRTATEIADTIKAAFEEILDNWIGLAGRFRGPGLEDATNTVAKRIERADAKDELDRLCYLDGSALIESQGRIRTVKMMRDGAGGDSPVASFPLGSYTPVDGFGPGYSTRTDEYFVRWDWSDVREAFNAERRYLNATAIGNIGGIGIYTTQQLDEETARWISTQAVADAVGDRVPNHFGNGLIVWRIRSHYWHPELELGDVVTIEANRFVGRSPINDQEIRGRVYALAIVTRIGDLWGTDLDLWVPGFDKIVVATGDVTLHDFTRGIPFLIEYDQTTRSYIATPPATQVLHTVTIPGRLLGPKGRFRVRGVWDMTAGGGDTNAASIVFGSFLVSTTDGTSGEFVFDLEFINDGDEVSQLLNYEITTPTNSFTGRGTPSEDTTADVTLSFRGQIDSASSAIDLIESRVEYMGDSQ